MSLSLYKKKRHFSETPEPEGKEKLSKGSLRFVIQKHDASHLHYDFRLEMEGVLKSWAVPKGPSLNPSDKRLAMVVEDHPYDYRNFEGVIPEGNYGGGTVIVWDEGTYEPLGGKGLSRKEQEKLLLKGLYGGSLKLIMHGSKIKGEFALFKLKGDRNDGKSWMLMKKNDEFATEEDVKLQNKSVKSGKTLAQVAEENGAIVKHPEEDVKPQKKQKPIQLLSAPKKSSGAKKSTRTKEKASPKKSAKAKRKFSQSGIKDLLGDYFHSATKVAMPQDVVPMLATLVDEPFDHPDWIYEIKWDGYRAVAYCNGNNVELISRNKKPFTEKYAPVADALSELGLTAVFDGEIVAVDEKGLANFQLLQNVQNTVAKLQFFIFDIIWLEGYDVTALPLIERKRILNEILPDGHEVIKFSDHVTGEGNNFFKVALSQGLEGIMAKKSNSSYRIDQRSEDWVKIKVNLRQEVIITGYTQPRNTRQFFGSLLLGVYHEGELKYIVHTGSGFNKKSLEAIYNKLQPLVTDTCPFEKCPKGNMPVTWVKPKLVCEIKFTEWTKDWMARHPIFMGLRADKKAADVIIEKAKNMAKMKSGQKSEAKSEKSKVKAQKAATKKTTAKKSASNKTASKKTAAKKTAQKKSPVKSKISNLQLDLAADNDQQITLNGNTLEVTNLNKLYWKKEGFSTGDMINYYLKIAPYIMPYMQDRPVSLNRHPNGIEAPNFFQKDMRGKAPEWADTFDEFSESTNVTVEYLVCKDEATLIYMANLGCIEMNPWHTRTASPLSPDWCLIDLDPDKTNSFDEVIDTALVVKKVLDAIGADCCVKTSGSSGIHIYIPLGGKYDFDQSKQLAELIVTMVNQELPGLTSIERSPEKRKGMIYLDFLQNRETQTAAAPYSLRPKPGVPVSTPLDWSELKHGLTPKTWHAKNIFERLAVEGDLFKPALSKGIDLEKVLKKMSSLTK